MPTEEIDGKIRDLRAKFAEKGVVTADDRGAAYVVSALTSAVSSLVSAVWGLAASVGVVSEQTPVEIAKNDFEAAKDFMTQILDAIVDNPNTASLAGRYRNLLNLIKIEDKDDEHAINQKVEKIFSEIADPCFDALAAAPAPAISTAATSAAEQTAQDVTLADFLNSISKPVTYVVNSDRPYTKQDERQIENAADGDCATHTAAMSLLFAGLFLGYSKDLIEKILRDVFKDNKQLVEKDLYGDLSEKAFKDFTAEFSNANTPEQKEEFAKKYLHDTSNSTMHFIAACLRHAAAKHTENDENLRGNVGLEQFKPKGWMDLQYLHKFLLVKYPEIGNFIDIPLSNISERKNELDFTSRHTGLFSPFSLRKHIEWLCTGGTPDQRHYVFKYNRDAVQSTTAPISDQDVMLQIAALDPIRENFEKNYGSLYDQLQRKKNNQEIDKDIYQEIAATSPEDGFEKLRENLQSSFDRLIKNNNKFTQQYIDEATKRFNDIQQAYEKMLRPATTASIVGSPSGAAPSAATTQASSEQIEFVITGGSLSDQTAKNLPNNNAEYDHDYTVIVKNIELPTDDEILAKYLLGLMYGYNKDILILPTLSRGTAIMYPDIVVDNVANTLQIKIKYLSEIQPVVLLNSLMEHLKEDNLQPQITAEIAAQMTTNSTLKELFTQELLKKLSREYKSSATTASLAPRLPNMPSPPHSLMPSATGMVGGSSGPQPPTTAVSPVTATAMGGGAPLTTGPMPQQATFAAQNTDFQGFIKLAENFCGKYPVPTHTPDSDPPPLTDFYLEEVSASEYKLLQVDANATGTPLSHFGTLKPGSFGEAAQMDFDSNTKSSYLLTTLFFLQAAHEKIIAGGNAQEIVINLPDLSTKQQAIEVFFGFYEALRRIWKDQKIEQSNELLTTMTKNGITFFPAINTSEAGKQAFYELLADANKNDFLKHIVSKFEKVHQDKGLKPDEIEKESNFLISFRDAFATHIGCDVAAADVKLPSQTLLSGWEPPTRGWRQWFRRP